MGFFPPCSLAERSLCLIAVFSPPFPSVLTGRGGYNLEVQLRWNSEVSIAGIGASRNGGSMNSGRAGRGAAAAARTSPGPGPGIKAASGPGGTLGSGRVILQYGGGIRLSPPESCRISFFYHQSIFVPLLFFPFPSGYRTLSK